MADRSGFDEFVATRSPALLRTAYLLTGDHGLAEDLLQTALAKCWFAWVRIDGPPEPYVRRALATTYATWWRRRWRGERPTGQLPDRGDPAAATTSTTGTRCGGRSVPCRAGSGRSWCCATTRTSPRPRPRPRSASRSER